MILETERLYLREMGQNDFGDLAEILQNPNVMYAYEHDFSDNDVQEWLDRQIERYKNYGFGLWAVILKNTNEMIGQAGLTLQPYKDTEVLEIGYLLKEKFWQKKALFYLCSTLCSISNPDMKKPPKFGGFSRG